MVEDSSESKTMPNRRSFLKSSAVIAGAAAIGAGAIYAVSPRYGAVPTVTADAFLGYAFLGPKGEISIRRDASGNISQIEYGPMLVQVNRNLDASISSIETTISSDSIKVVDTVNRGTDGIISGVTRQWPS